MKIAWFTPFSTKSAIGQCSSIIIEQLAKRANVTVYVSDATDKRDTWLPEAQQILMKSMALPDIVRSLEAFDIAIYNLGDNYLLHSNIFAVSRHYPGIVILHDLVMHHFFSGYYFLELKDEQGYTDELGFAHGEAGRELAKGILAGKLGNIWESDKMLHFHMAKAALHGSLGVVVHSQFVQKEIEAFATYPLTHINFPAAKTSPKSKGKSQQDKIHFLSFGMLNSNKMIDQVIELMHTSSLLHSQVIYDIIGTGNEDYVKLLHERIQKHKLHDVVQLHGYQPDEVLQQHIDAADVIINLRNPHFGEASWVLLEAAFSGKPTVVWKHGYYDEYPDAAVVKVTDETLLSSLELVASNAVLRQQLSENIQRYAKQTFVTDRYCQEILSFIDEVRRAKPLLMLTDRLSHHMQEIDPQHRELLHLVSTEISRLLPE